MLEPGLRRALVVSTLTIAAMFAAGAAQAQQPPPAPLTPPAFETHAALPPPAKPLPFESPRPRFDLGYSAPALAPIPFEQQPTYPPEMRSRSTGMIAGGVVLLSFGMVGLFAGSALVSAHEPLASSPTTCSDCNFDGSGSVSSGPAVVLKPGLQAAGIVTLVGSVAAIGASIPLIVVGAKKVPYVDDASPAAKAARLTPTLHVGPATAMLTWQF